MTVDRAHAVIWLQWKSAIDPPWLWAGLLMLDRVSKGPMRVRTLFLSDIHLGSKGCQADKLLDFLRHYEADTVYLVGDIVDGWQLKANWYWPQTHNDVVQKLLRQARKGARLLYIPGNHDEFLRDYYGTHFGGIDVLEDAIHVGPDGKRYLVIHGDLFDVVIRHARWLALLGNNAYDLAIWLNTHFNAIRRAFGLTYWSLSQWAKLKVKNAVNFIGEYETTLAAEARRRGVDGVICGHIHHAVIRSEFGLAYINCGDWVESCTAVVEHFDGRLRDRPVDQPRTASRRIGPRGRAGDDANTAGIGGGRHVGRSHPPVVQSHHTFDAEHHPDIMASRGNRLLPRRLVSRLGVPVRAAVSVRAETVQHCRCRGESAGPRRLSAPARSGNPGRPAGPRQDDRVERSGRAQQDAARARLSARILREPKGHRSRGRDLGGQARSQRLLDPPDGARPHHAAGFATATAQDWLDDAREALAIGRRIGDRVVLIGISTGALLATMAALEDNSPDIAALVLLSPNFAIRDWRGRFISGPLGRLARTHRHR